mmetsp:Transcript_21930/g.43528  ORF Transcript_21930/g.43528 Transcript_21930/m.43528 type:complete len:85 (+) Transcript_21930:58-312(+)
MPTSHPTVRSKKTKKSVTVLDSQVETSGTEFHLTLEAPTGAISPPPECLGTPKSAYALSSRPNAKSSARPHKKLRISLILSAVS